MTSGPLVSILFSSFAINPIPVINERDTTRHDTTVKMIRAELMGFNPPVQSMTNKNKAEADKYNFKENRIIHQRNCEKWDLDCGIHVTDRIIREIDEFNKSFPHLSTHYFCIDKIGEGTDIRLSFRLPPYS